MRFKIKDGINYRYIILNPQKESGHGKRRTFAIEKRTFDLVKWRATSTSQMDNPTLDSINARFLTQEIDWESARKNVEEIVSDLYQSDKAISAIVHNTDNYKALDQYLGARYPESRRKKLSDFNSLKYECQRAIEALGSISILSSNEREIQDQVDTYCSGFPNKQRRIINKLKSILAYLRPNERFELVKDQEEYWTTKHLTEVEFESILPYLPEEKFKILAQVCFHTGCRVGEAFAFSLSDLKESRNTVLINKQITKEGHELRKVKGKTKNKKIRDTFIFPAGIQAFKEWVLIKESVSKDERLHLGRLMTLACQKSFPRNEDKHLVWHDLRHSYAIRLLDKGLTIDTVAKMIGDSTKVTEKYYVGFIVSEPTMDLVRMKVLNSLT